MLAIIKNKILGNENGLKSQTMPFVSNGFLTLGSEVELQLIDESNYNLSSWITDYNQESIGRYYTQRWYIYRRDAGSETLCNYIPPTDDNSIINGGEWYRISTSDKNFYPSSSQYEAIKQNSER